MKKVGVTSPVMNEFIRRDIEILSDEYDVRIVSGTPISGSYARCTNILKNISLAKWSDVVLQWFADVHALISSMFGRLSNTKNIVIVGGYDVADIPRFEYGNLRNLWKKRITRYVLDSSNQVLPVSKAVSRDVINSFNIENTKIDVVPLGFDPEKYTPGNRTDRDGAITVAAANNINRARLKGLDTFVEAAKEFPDIPFQIVGVSGEAKRMLQARASENVTLTGEVEHETLIDLYKKYKIYCQLSLRESFGSALAEAMLCGCTPVGHKVSAIPETIGETGYLVEPYEFDSLIQAIRLALENESSLAPRNYVKSKYNIEKRRHSLTKLIDEL